MDRIKLSEIFDFSDISDIKKAADKISEELGSALDIVRAKAKAMKDELGRMQPSEQVAGMVADAEKLAKQYKALEDAQKQLTAQTKLLTDSQEQLDASTKQVTADTQKAEQAQEEAANSVAELRKQVKAAKKEYESLSGSLGDTSEEARQAKQRFFELDKQLKDHNKSVREDAKTAGMASDSYNEWQRTVRLAEQRLKALEDPMGKNREEAQRLTKVINENKDKLKQFDASIGNFQRNVGNYRSALDGVKGSLKEMLLMGGIAGAATAGVEMLKDSVLYAAQYDDALADVRKTTGMSVEETKKLSDQLAELDTRTSQMDLVNIAKIGGSVGVASSEMAGFVESVDKAVVALGDEFTGGAEEVANALGRIKGLFQETRGLEFGDAMNRIGSMMNELGAISSATAPNIADFMQRVGQLGSMSPSIDAVAALGAVLQDAGLSAEIASGGFTNVVLTMGKELPKFQDYIMGNKDAAELLKQEGGDLAEVFNRDTAKAVNILAAAFKGMPADKVVKDLGNLKIGTQESIKVLQALAVKQDDYNKFLDVSNKQLKEATSLTNEFNIKNNTQQAFIDKAVKKFKELTLVVGQWLWGAFGKVIEVMQKVYKALEPLIEFVGALAVGFFKVAEVIFGVVLGAIEAIADAFSWLWGSTSDAEEALEDFTEQTAEAVAEVDGLFMALDKTTHTQEENKKAMQAINDQYGKYLPNLLNEKSSLEEIAAARQLVIDAIYAEMAAKMKQEAINNAMADSLKQQMKAQKALADITGYSQGKIMEFAKFEERVALARWANDKAFLAQNAEKIKALDEFKNKVNEGGTVAIVAWDSIKKSQDSLKENITEINEAFDPYIKSVQTYDHSAKKATETTDTLTESVSTSTTELDKNTEATKKNTDAKKANYDVTDELLQQQILEDYKNYVSDSIDATIDLTDAEYEQAKLRREQMEIMQEMRQKDYEIRKEQLNRQLDSFVGEGKNEVEARKRINKELFTLEMERIRAEMELLEMQGKTNSIEYEKLLTEQQKLTMQYLESIENAKPKKSVFEFLAEDTNDLIDALERLSDVTGGDDSKFGKFIKNVAAVVQVGQGFASTAVSLKGFREGGYTGDMPADAVAGVVHGGEYVLTAQEVQRLGKQNIELWKEGKTPMHVGTLPMGLDLEELGRVIAKNVPVANLDPIAGAIATTKKELGKVIQVIRKTR